MTSVGDILELSYGKALKEADRSGGDVPVVGSGGIVGAHSAGITDAPTIVVGRKGSIGSVTWIDGPAWPIDTAYFVRPKSDDVDPRWTYWMLKSLRMETMNKSAAVPGLNRDDVYRLSIKLPSRPEQRRIAAILDHADALRAKRRQVLADLDDLPQCRFTSLFGDPISNPSRLPVKVLRDWVDAERPITYGILKPGPHIPDGVPYVRVADMKDRGIAVAGVRRTTAAIAAEYRRSTLQPGDLLMSIRGHVGRFAFVPADLAGGNITQDSARLAVQDPDCAIYIRAAMETPSVQHWMARRTKGAAVKGINLGDLRELPIPLPPGSEIKRFAEFIRVVERQRQRAQAASRPVAQLFASLQFRAFRGEL